MRDAAGELQLALELLEDRVVAGQLGADRLERDALVQLEILGGVDLAHAALTQAPLDAEAIGDGLAGHEGAQLGEDDFGDSLGVPDAIPARHGGGRMVLEQREERAFQARIAGAIRGRERPLIGGRGVEGLLEQRLQPSPALRCHCVDSSFRIQARAMLQSRLIVRSETSIAAAISRSVKPAKKRISTTVACVASIARSCSSRRSTL